MVGHDYLVMDVAQLGFDLTRERIRLICDRNKGVGSDGILLRIDQSRRGFFREDFQSRWLRSREEWQRLRIFAKFPLRPRLHAEQTIHRRHPRRVVHVELRLDDSRVTTVQVAMAGRQSIGR